jgi:serine/threonine protein kinase
MFEMSRELRPEGVIYRIDEAIGQGLSATVYRAVREDSRGFARQTVALKILKSENAVPWLRREFETLTRVRSANCVRVLGWENLKEGCAIVLEWIDGISLLELARGRILPEPVQLSILAQIQNGLRALSSEGLFHGDLSPANILIDRDGIVKLIDFATPPPEEQGLLGTLEYLAPEIWKGGRKSLKGDLFSLGLIARDICNGFEEHPLDALQARRRCERLAEEGTGWLASESPRREFIDIAAGEKEKRELANLVREHLARRIRIETAFAEPAEPEKIVKPIGRRVTVSRVRRSSLMALLASSFLLIGVSRAGAPSLEKAQRGTLEVRSMRWLEVSLNGRPIGYAPVQVQNLHPGRHRLSWKSATGAGETMVLIKEGAKVLLREPDLIALSRQGALVPAEPALKD